jgi:poly-gamma-glutamate system protein
MKTLYYRPKKLSKSVLLSLAGLSLVVMILVECFPAKKLDGMESVKLDAAKRAEAAITAVGDKRLELNHRWIKSLDPAKTMLIGPTMSTVTTQVGHLDAKQTSVNPNFAAVVVEMLHTAGVKRGDRIAIGCTGSFPALDIAVYTAADAMELRPTIISSATSSQYGANDPELMWPDMEKLLFEKGLISTRSIATSIGGVGDRGVGMTEDVLENLLEVIDRNDVPLLRQATLVAAVRERMRLYDEAAGDEKYTAYINVGGGSASVRGTKGNAIIGDGIIFPDDADLTGVKDCAALKFLERKVPIINLINAINLAETYGLAVAPVTKVPVGEGQVYGRTVYRRWWALAGIALILTAAWLIMHPTPALERLLHGKDAQPAGQLMV